MSAFDLSFLDSLPVTTIGMKRGHKTVVALSSRMPVVDALTALVKEEILSAPVYDDDSHDFVATLDLRDLVNLVARSFKQHGEVEPNLLLATLGDDEVFRRPLKDAFGFVGRAPDAFFAVKESASLGEVLRRMVATGDRTHRRALVFGEGGTHDPKNLKLIVSQSAVINVLAAHKSKLGPALNQSIADAWHVDWEVSKSRVVSIPANASMVEAFALMEEKDISGLAVVDEHGLLLGTVGSRDIKGLVAQGPLDMTKLRLTTREYINYIKMLSVEEKHPAISVKKTDSMATLLGKFASTHVHRIFVIDESNAPIGVVSTIDLLNVICGKHSH